MSSHQEHFGRKFYQDKETGYWISVNYSKEKPRTRAHQWVWFNNYGKPPKGYHIHHVNEDRSDNRIENLELMKGSRHLSFHMVKHMLDPKKKKQLQDQCNIIRPLTKEWHASEEGRAWHKYHALKNNFGNPEPTKYACQQCNKEYFSKLIAKGRTRFCSNPCKSKWRRDQGVDEIEKICLNCTKHFMNNKYSKQVYCCRSCAQTRNKNAHIRSYLVMGNQYLRQC